MHAPNQCYFSLIICYNLMENNYSKGGQALSMIPKQNVVDKSSSTGEPECPKQQQDKNLIKQNLI